MSIEIEEGYYWVNHLDEYVIMKYDDLNWWEFGMEYPVHKDLVYIIEKVK